MRNIFVLVEHRQGEIRDITFEMLSKCNEIAKEINVQIIALLLGNDVERFLDPLKEYADTIMVVKDERLEFFNSKMYQAVLTHLINEHKPLLTMIGHTSYGIDLAPGLAVKLQIPLATDCADFAVEDDQLKIVRQMYVGKVNVKATLKKAESYLITIRPASFEAKESETKESKVINLESPLKEEPIDKRFIKYVEPEVSDVDITASDILVSIGRGIKEDKNIPVIEELATALGGVLSCSRPIVDKGWLDKGRQVGTSGKTVKPKLYLALGISGAFQHAAGMKDSELVVAINKDANAPIFNVSDFGIVDDLFKVVPELTQKINEMKSM
ncbi:MAG: electron transfer flavoprotein subunit alpha/FixB family protein [Promethearchaeota archaeon]